MFSSNKSTPVKVVGIVDRSGISISCGTPTLIFTIVDSLQIFHISSTIIEGGTALMRHGDEIEFSHKDGWIKDNDIKNTSFAYEATISVD